MSYLGSYRGRRKVGEKKLRTLVSAACLNEGRTRVSGYTVTLGLRDR